MSGGTFVQRMLAGKLLGELADYLPVSVRDTANDLRQYIQQNGRFPKFDPLREAPLGDTELAQALGLYLGDVPSGAQLRLSNIVKGNVHGALRGVNAVIGDLDGSTVQGLNVLVGSVRSGDIRGLNLLLGDVHGGSLRQVNVVIGNVYAGELSCQVLIGDVHGGQVKTKLMRGQVIAGDVQTG